MSIGLNPGSAVAKPGRLPSRWALVSVTSGNKPAAAFATLLDHNPYTAS
jgi:hypothetical protein